MCGLHCCLLLAACCLLLTAYCLSVYQVRTVRISATCEQNTECKKKQCEQDVRACHSRQASSRSSSVAWDNLEQQHPSGRTALENVFTRDITWYSSKRVAQYFFTGHVLRTPPTFNIQLSCNVLLLLIVTFPCGLRELITFESILNIRNIIYPYLV